MFHAQVCLFAGFFALATSASAQSSVYVSGGGTVFAIDTASNSVQATVGVGGFDSRDVVLTPDGNKAYVMNYSGWAVAVVDTTSNQVVASIPIPAPWGAAVTPDGKRLYVGSVTNAVPFMVYIVDTATDTVSGTVNLGAFRSSPTGALAVAPNGATVYVAAGDGIKLIDVSTNTVLPPLIPVAAHGIVFTPDGRKMYASDDFTASIAVIDVAANTVSRYISPPHGARPWGLAVSPDGSRVYATDNNLNCVYVIDTAADSTIATIPVGGGSLGIAILPTGAAAYVANGYPSPSASAISASSNTVTATIGLFGYPWGVAVRNADRIPPIISGMPASGCSIWPPNHKLVLVADVRASDAQSGLAPGSLSVTGVSNEPSNPADPDIVIGPDGLGGFQVRLRADRLGSGSGRVYTIHAGARDLAGNTATATATCIVPHDQIP